MSFKKVKKTLFLTKKSTFEKEENVNLILSPEFYWIREFEIPVKNKKEAYPFIENLFSEVLPKDEYSYFLIKKEHHKFLAFAYKNDEIIKYIKASNLEVSKVHNIFFAQTELSHMDSFSSGKTSFAKTEDGLLVKLPFNVKEANILEDDLYKHIPSKHKVNFQFYNSFVDKKYIYSFSVLILILAFFNFFKYAVYVKSNNIVSVKEEQLKSKYKMPTTLIETDAIMLNMRSKFLKDEAFRKAVGAIFDYKKYDRNVIFKVFKYEKKVFILELENSSASRIVSYFKPIFKKVSQKTVNKKIRVELMYE